MRRSVTKGPSCTPATRRGASWERSARVGLLSALVIAAILPGGTGRPAVAGEGDGGLFARENLIAWCIVPFDAKRRGPEERAAMLERLGIKHFAYDWRAEHVPTFDAEVEALQRHGIALDAFWVAPGELNRESRLVLDLLARHKVKAQLWAMLDLGADRATGAEQERRIEAAAAKLGPLARAADAIGCTVGLYNHGGWFGEPENQIAIIERLKERGTTNLGMVYNLHHGHDHLDRFAELLAKMKPYLLALNLNGTFPDGDRIGKKIVPLGQGPLDLRLLKTIRASGYSGPIGILGHTQDDAEERLKDNLEGLDWLVAQLDGKPAGPRPRPRTYTAPVAVGPPPSANVPNNAAEQVARLIADARAHGNPERGAEVFASAQFGCVSCHKAGKQGGVIGPELTAIGNCVPPEQIVEAVLWPGKQVREGYMALAVATTNGNVIQGYKLSETDDTLVLREAATGVKHAVAKADIEAVREQGSLMPEGLAEAMTADQRRDVVRFLLDLGRPGNASADTLMAHAHSPVTFPYDNGPLRPDFWPNRHHPINRDRLYDFYAKEADYFRSQPILPKILPPFPGIDGGTFGHWGTQNEETWADDRWNDADLGTLLCGVFRGAGVTVPKGVCVRLGERGELAACFNPETLSYEALWRGGFVTFSAVRHGFMDGLNLEGTALPRPAGGKPTAPFVYHGFYRWGKRVLFSYRIGETEMLDAPWAEDGRFTRVVGPAATHPLASWARGGAPQWPQALETRGEMGQTQPYAIDTIEVPFQNPWNVPMFCGDHDFLPDGSALLCTMQGDVWHITGLDDSLESVRWRRFASGLHHALGLVVAEGRAYVLGRDQITRLTDLNHDGEADFYECINNKYTTSPNGHDFICGLQRDAKGRFYTVSGKQGLVRLAPDGSSVEVLATGFRNPDGLGLTPDGVITVPCSEGEWTPASMICQARPGGYYGYGGPKDGRPPDLPLVYVPRGVDNSSGGQVFVSSDRWGPTQGRMVHLSYGTCTAFLLLRDQVAGTPQGALVPLPGEFRSGAHRGRFHPRDGQLYVSGMGGWGHYSTADGSFQRMRYTGAPVQLPTAFRAHENGVRVTFARPVDRALAERATGHFAQAWNYRYSAAYGSPELSPSHPGMPGHDPLPIRSASVSPDGLTLFLELPDLQPVNQLHLYLRVDDGPPVEMFLTVHKLAPPYTEVPNYQPVTKTIAAHPILRDLATAATAVPNPWRGALPEARPIEIEARGNLTYSVNVLTARPGEPLALTFRNPDVVPHNWALIKPGTLAQVGDLVNKFIAEPDALARHYVPRSDDVLVYTDIVYPHERATIYFRAPESAGRYPFLCTFPGHWMVMNGVLVVGESSSP